MQEAAERAFRDNTVQPFSAAELASIGYVDVPAAERFTFGVPLSDGYTLQWMSACSLQEEGPCLLASRHALPYWLPQQPSASLCTQLHASSEM